MSRFIKYAALSVAASFFCLVACLLIREAMYLSDGDYRYILGLSQGSIGTVLAYRYFKETFA